MLLWAKYDIKSHLRPNVIYAEKGEQLEVYREWGDVVFCKGKNGTFPTKRKNLSEIPIERNILPDKPVKKR